MFSRVYKFPSQSVLLLGPRGVGKSTFIRNQTVLNLEIDLLKSTHYRELSNQGFHSQFIETRNQTF